MKIGMLVLLVIMASCKTGGSLESKPDVAQIDYPCVEVPVGNRVIQGRKWTGSIPEYTQPAIQGAFLEGRRVKLSPYEIGKYEVSYKIWKDVCTWASSHGYTGLENVGSAGNNENIPKEQWDKQPVTNMTWCDVVVWCNALTEMEKENDEECVYRNNDGKVLKNAQAIPEVSLAKWEDKKGYRLPSQVEWEVGARYSKDATNATNYAESGEPIYLINNTSASGGKLPIAFKGITENTDYEAMKKELQRIAVVYGYFDGTKNVEFNPPIKFTSTIGSKAPNDLGCFDMSGNVAEFCYDWAEFAISFDKNNVEENPKGPKTPSENDFAKVIRGGAVLNQAHYVATAYTNYLEKIEDKYKDIGFRLARTK